MPADKAEWSPLSMNTSWILNDEVNDEGTVRL